MTTYEYPLDVEAIKALLPHRDPFLMIDEVLEELRSAISKTHEALKRDLGRLRTGRAHSGMLDAIRVDYYGQMTPIAQMAATTTVRARRKMERSIYFLLAKVCSFPKASSRHQTTNRYGEGIRQVRCQRIKKRPDISRGTESQKILISRGSFN